MKDKEARDDIRGLKERARGLETRVNLQEKDCPVCGHVTLMKMGWTCRHDIDGGFVSTTTWGPLGVRNDTPQMLYCYSCGKTFKESEGLVEVTSPQ